MTRWLLKLLIALPVLFQVAPFQVCVLEAAVSGSSCHDRGCDDGEVVGSLPDCAAQSRSHSDEQCSCKSKRDIASTREASVHALPALFASSIVADVLVPQPNEVAAAAARSDSPPPWLSCAFSPPLLI